jgi:hypothetical protein
MKKLGYIVSDRDIKGLKSFVGNVRDISQTDPTKPILIIGYKNAQKHPNFKNILDKKLDNNVFWTFKKTESHSDYEVDIENFYKYTINNILKITKYYYINMLAIRYNKFKKLYNILLYSKERKHIYFSSKMIYFSHNGNMFGISLSLLDYCGVSSDKIINRIKSNRNNIICYDNNNKVHNIVKEIGYNNRYAVPYLMELLE